MAMAPDSSKNQVQSAAKVFAVLRAFDAARPQMTMAEVAAHTGLDRGTTFRLIHTLVSLGYVAAVPNSKRFRLTLKCLELGYLALSSQDLRGHAAPLLAERVPTLADAGSLAVLDGADVIYLERVQSGQARHDLDRRPGRRIRAYAAAIGHAQLAYKSEAEQVAILESVERVKLSDKTLVDLDALLDRLRLVRAQGYAVSDGENAYGLRTVAAAVLDPEGNPLAGVSLTIDAGRMPLDAFVAAAKPEILKIAADLTLAVRQSAGVIGVGTVGP